MNDIYKAAVRPLAIHTVKKKREVRLFLFDVVLLVWCLRDAHSKKIAVIILGGGVEIQYFDT